MDKLKEIKAALDKTDKEFKQIRAEMPMTDANNEIYWKCIDSCYSIIDGLRKYVYNLEDHLYKTISDHNAGHLPKILGAEKMQNALEVLGIDGDYELEKPTIYVRANQGGNIFDIDLKLSK